MPLKTLQVGIFYISSPKTNSEEENQHWVMRSWVRCVPQAPYVR